MGATNVQNNGKKYEKKNINNWQIIIKKKQKTKKQKTNKTTEISYNFCASKEKKWNELFKTFNITDQNFIFICMKKGDL